ncbi:MAG: hypothetical protein HY820_12100 [Acidobacteria bacterium]|nr:hypothetical protein [Acidobacteriota bacterium]
MTRKITAVIARTQFGQPAVLILSVTDFVNTLAPTPDWLKGIQADAKRKGLDKLTMAECRCERQALRICTVVNRARIERLSLGGCQRVL